MLRYFVKKHIFTGHEVTFVLQKKSHRIKCHHIKGLINGKSCFFCFLFKGSTTLACSPLTISHSVSLRGLPQPVSLSNRAAVFLYPSASLLACWFNMQASRSFGTRRCVITQQHQRTRRHKSNCVPVRKKDTAAHIYHFIGIKTFILQRQPSTLMM